MGPSTMQSESNYAYLVRASRHCFIFVSFPLFEVGQCILESGLTIRNMGEASLLLRVDKCLKEGSNLIAWWVELYVVQKRED